MADPPNAQGHIRLAAVAEVKSGHRDEIALGDPHIEFLAQLPDQRLRLGLSLLDVPTGQVPDVRVPPTSRAAMPEQDSVDVNQSTDDNMRHPDISAGSGRRILDPPFGYRDGSGPPERPDWVRARGLSSRRRG
jgi:hypothetical protein